MSVLVRLAFAAWLATPGLAPAQTVALDASFEAGIAAPRNERERAAYGGLSIVDVDTKRPGLALPFAGVDDPPGVSLDAITLTSAVPEPSNYMLLLAGLGVVGLVVLRRR